MLSASAAFFTVSPVTDTISPSLISKVTSELRTLYCFSPSTIYSEPSLADSVSVYVPSSRFFNSSTFPDLDSHVWLYSFGPVIVRIAPVISFSPVMSSLLIVTTFSTYSASHTLIVFFAFSSS